MEPTKIAGLIPGWRVGFCPQTRKTGEIFSTSGRQIWTKVQIYTPQISCRPHLGFGRNLTKGFRKNGESKIGGGALLGFTHFGGPHTHLNIASYSTGDSDKKWFLFGGIGPYLGEIWGFEI